VGANDRVCYHNMASKDDYGRYGHAEVVSLTIPKSSFEAFCEIYFNLFNKRGDRPDQLGDRGGEYRNLIGIPNKDPELIKIAEAVSSGINNGAVAVDAKSGVGSDEDKRAVTYVYDNGSKDKFPAYQAEFYHQFHDGFAPGENYPDSYNNIKNNLQALGILQDTKCPPI